MGNEEGETPTKTPKSTSSQDQPLHSPASVYPDWASFQQQFEPQPHMQRPYPDSAYYNSAGTPPLPPPAFFHSPIPSNPHTHPYMWGQHLMPPFGAPHPYVTMYPHGGLYGHPPIPPGSHPYAPYAMSAPNGTAEVSVPPAAGTELEGKSADGKRGTALKKSKESLGSLSTLTGKSYDMGKASGASTNCGDSNSSNSENGTSSEGTDVNSQNGSHNRGFRQGSTDADEVQNGSAFVAMPASKQNSGSQTVGMMALPSNGMVPSATNLNIGMDFWGRSATPAVAANHGKVAAVPCPPSIIPNNFMGARDGISSDLWLQDEKEMKRQRRKQSNRESARRSRLRKQAECEELAQRVESLRQENSSLREELEQMRVDCQKLVEENTSLSERLQKQESEQPVPDQEVEHTMED